MAGDGYAAFVMEQSKFQPASFAEKSERFEETNWWVVREAAHPELGRGDAARTSLCRTYWSPIFAYIRRMGYGREDAQDLTQEFFARMLKKNYIRAAAREKGRFRSYLLVMLKRFLADHWDRTHRKKRGGGLPQVSLEQGDATFRTKYEPADDLTPDKIFDRAWAESLLNHALEVLEKECVAAGRRDTFQLLRPFITCEGDTTYAEIGGKLGMTANNVKVAVHRLRRRFRDLLRAEIAKTAHSSEEVEAEMRDLQAIFREICKEH